MLVDSEIIEALCARDIIINPFDYKSVQPNSYDLRLSNTFAQYDGNNIIDPFDEDSVIEGLEKERSDYIIIYPGDFYLASTIESIQLNNNISAVLEGKSSLARLGIVVHQTGGFIDSGFSGNITLELSNVNPAPVKLYYKMPIAQIAFYRMNRSPNKPYNCHVGAKYNDQSGVTPSKYYQNAKFWDDYYLLCPSCKLYVKAKNEIYKLECSHCNHTFENEFAVWGV